MVETKLPKMDQPTLIQPLVQYDTTAKTNCTVMKIAINGQFFSQAVRLSVQNT
jgi:hypothetical protein